MEAKPDNYALLSNGDIIVDSLNDVELFAETQQCMGVLNFSGKDFSAFLRDDERDKLNV